MSRVCSTASVIKEKKKVFGGFGKGRRKYVNAPVGTLAKRILNCYSTLYRAPMDYLLDSSSTAKRDHTDTENVLFPHFFLFLPKTCLTLVWLFHFGEKRPLLLLA